MSTDDEPELPEHVARAAERLGAFAFKERDNPDPAMDAAEFMDANADCHVIEQALPTLKDPQVREAMAGMTQAWRRFRDQRVNYVMDDGS